MPAVSPFAAVSGDNSKRDEDRVTWGLLLIYLLSTVYGENCIVPPNSVFCWPQSASLQQCLHDKARCSCFFWLMLHSPNPVQADHSLS